MKLKFNSIYLFFFLNISDGTYAKRRGRLLVPYTYTAFSSDLYVQLHWDNELYKSSHDLRLQLSRIENLSSVIISVIDIYPDPRSNVTQITIPCQYFLLGGSYELEVIGNDVNSTNNDNYDERLKQQLDVRWPIPKLSVTPESIGTYPEQPLSAILEYPGVECLLPNNDKSPNVPEFWLELLYCGHDVYCASSNVTKSQILYTEQVRGFPKTRIVQLRCELFGLAGHYIFRLKPAYLAPSTVSASAYIKVRHTHTHCQRHSICYLFNFIFQADWSDQFVFNVHASSIRDCQPYSGIEVLFEYPSCILEKSDRVRIFGKLRADVASMASPTSLHYISEQRVLRGQHSLRFDCDLFSEKFDEYCFVYVSQAITGAVADVRMDCVPTRPVNGE